MRKVVVFDGGWGGKNVADYLTSELGVVEVECVINCEARPYELMRLEEIYSLAEESLKPYFNKVDLIVLGGYMSSLALEILQEKYPDQRFVGMGIDYRLIYKTKRRPKAVTIMGDELLVRLPVWSELRTQLPEVSLIAPDCSGWESLIDMGEMSSEIIEGELGEYFFLARSPTIDPPKGRPPLIRRFWRRTTEAVSNLIRTDTILLLNTHYWGFKSAFEQIFGYGVRVLDFRQKLLHDVCLALNLRGVDGRLGE